MNRSRFSLGRLAAGCWTLSLCFFLALPSNAARPDRNVSPDLTDIVSGAEAAMGERDFDTALDLFQHAQHLIHREAGVLSAQQNPILEKMAIIYLANGSFAKANNMMELQHRIVRHESSDSPEATAPSWQTLGHWYQKTLQPKKSQEAFATALALMKDHSLPRGEIASIQLHMLKNQYLLVGCCDIEAALAELQGHQLSSEQWLELGDLALLAGEQEHALNFYRNSAATVPATPIGVSRIDHMARTYVEATLDRRSRMGIVTSAEMTPTQLVGAPLPVCESRLADISGQGDYSDFSMDLEFRVTETGDVRKVKVLSGNAPRAVKSLVRAQLRSVTYRPELVAGVAKTSEILVSQEFDKLAHLGPSEQRSATQLGCIAAARALEQDLFVVGVH